MQTINPALVEQINTLVAAWTAADRRCREFFHGWEQRAICAGLERGFYVQVGMLPGADALSETEDSEQGGREVYAAYVAGGMAANRDTIRA